MAWPPTVPGRLYVAANGADQVWRIEPDGAICALARGLRFPSAVALGQGPRGFRAANALGLRPEARIWAGSSLAWMPHRTP